MSQYLCSAPFVPVVNRTAHPTYLTDCFTSLAITTPIYALLALLSALMIGWTSGLSGSLSNTNIWSKRLSAIKSLIVLIILAIVLSETIVLCTQSSQIRAYYLSQSVEIFSLILYSISLILAAKRNPSSHTNASNNLILIPIVLSSVNQLYTNIVRQDHTLHQLICSSIALILWLITLILTVLLSTKCKPTAEDQNPLIDSEQRTNDISVICHSIDNQLKCDESANIFSKLFLIWVNPLMTRGVQQKISSHNDLFRLPHKISSQSVSVKFHSIFDLSSLREEIDEEVTVRTVRTKSLLKSLLRCYGFELLFVGCLKFGSDILSFAGPLLLNQVVQYLESNDHNNIDGFYYAIGLFVSTFLASILISLFNFYINNISLKIRSSVITSIYDKIFSVRSDTLNSHFSTGEILNFASTDTDRVVNFCPSLLQFISLPIQLSVTLYLLYQLLGLAFVTGVVFAIVLIPINRWICNKIGELSAKMMEWKDKRIKLMSEILMGIRVIKMHSWEDLFEKRIIDLREQEVKYLKGRKYLDAFCVYFWATTPVLISSLVFGTFVLLNGKLTAPIVFTSLALLGMLIMPLNAFPWVLNGLMESWISIKRLQKLFDLHPLELSKHYNMKMSDESHKLKIQVVGASFNSAESSAAGRETVCRFVLGPIDFTLSQKMFIGVIGKVGSGKSSLMNALLGEMQRISGKIGINDSDLHSGIGVVTQEPWIQNTTLMENILFGKPFDAQRYHSVLEACALVEDLQSFTEGDLTLIGDRGMTLSGGQKARISLARAVYQDYEIYLIDDPFASVDMHVGQHIYHNCILGLLKDKTKILCTHQQKYLLKSDLVLKLDSGQLMASGPPKDILKIKDNAKDKEVKFSDGQQSESVDDLETIIANSGREEEREEGVVKLGVYVTYLKSVGYKLSFVILLSMFLMQISKTASDIWLAFWTSNNRLMSVSAKSSTNYLVVFGCIAAINSVFTLFRSFIFAYGGVVAALRLHTRLLAKIFTAPVVFFDLTAFGRVINRFSSDVFNLDDGLPFNVNILLAQVYSLMASVLITVYGLPWIALLIIPLSIPYYFIQRYYRWTSRELKRLAAVSLSPIYTQLDESLQGLITIRAFATIQRFKREMYRKLDINNCIQYAIAGAQQWLNLRLQLLGVIISSGVAVLAVGLHYWSGQTIDSGLVGLALVYSLSVTGLLNGTVQSFAQTEMDMVSVERIMQYINNIESEQSIVGNSVSNVSAHLWPNKGVVSFNGVSMRYRNDTRLALEKVSFATKPFEKIGIVGRTGSGKSSLFQALFRLVSIEEGNIAIDGIDTSTVTLKQLRSNLFIIPQDPFLFSGTIRENLDPRSQHSDNEIWHSLQECHLESLILSLGGLSANISERGRDLSCGQRQLLCLVRALLSKTKILCLDEATASIDHNTEQLIQQTIRTVFSSATVLFVAHKIESVLDCDRILVMDSSRVAEMGSPDALIHNTASLFYSLCNR